jgi:farnesyl diphosphate synthase
MAEPALAHALTAVARDIDSSFDALLPLARDPHSRLIEAMRYAAIGGGKRLRPLLLTATAALFGSDRGTAIRAATALEAVHVYSLIHDDLPCMDDDALRHGKPTLHLAFDEATAVLAGDAFQAFAFDLLSDPDTAGDPFIRIELVRTLALASGAQGMVGGQALDMAAEAESFDLQGVTRLQQLKTGALLAAAVEMGAILGRVPAEGRTHLRGFARDVGLAFQIADDLLDHDSSVEALGKAAGKDAAAGKATFVSLLGPERAREQARLLVDQGISHLAQHGEEAELLRSIARYVVERDR